jgi:hypothetical protein
MVKNNESKVLITTRNIKYYKGKGYSCGVGDTISLNVDTMPTMSRNIVIAICELCNNEIEISYSKYNKNKSRQGFYSCKKCSNKKRKITNIKKYGVENIFQRDDVKDKNKKWMSSNEFRDKSKNKMIDLYGVDHYSKTNEFKEFYSIINKERIKNLKEEGNYDCPLVRSDNRNKRENVMFQKYGATYSFNIPEIKEKIQNINLEKFGHISPFGNREIKEKIKNIFIDRYGVDNPFKNKNIQQKIKDISNKRIEGIDKSIFKNYKKLVVYITRSSKITLFKNWDGFDYYDGEYIKDNLILNSNDPRYPTVDHKISSIFGYKNGIDPDQISKLDNLCITKKKINSMKGHLTEDEFRNIISNKK